MIKKCLASGQKKDTANGIKIRVLAEFNGKGQQDVFSSSGIRISWLSIICLMTIHCTTVNVILDEEYNCSAFPKLHLVHSITQRCHNCQIKNISVVLCLTFVPETLTIYHQIIVVSLCESIYHLKGTHVRCQWKHFKRVWDRGENTRWDHLQNACCPKGEWFSEILK